MSDSMGNVIYNFVATPPNQVAAEAQFGRDIKKILGAAILAAIIWRTGRPFSVGMLLVGAAVLRNQSLDKNPKFELLSKGTLLPMMQGAYIAAMFMPLATAFQAAGQSSTLFRKAATLILHPLLYMPLPFLMNGLMYHLDAGNKVPDRVAYEYERFKKYTKRS